jgi:hypothetical protein
VSILFCSKQLIDAQLPTSETERSACAVLLEQDRWSAKYETREQICSRVDGSAGDGLRRDSV